MSTSCAISSSESFLFSFLEGFLFLSFLIFLSSSSESSTFFSFFSSFSFLRFWLLMGSLEVKEETWD
jgi:hypothetical protein